LQMPDEAKIALCDYVLVNDGDIGKLAAQVDRVWHDLLATTS
jgi:dephospho-CoA kinase